MLQTKNIYLLLRDKRLEEEKLTRRCIYIDCFVHFPLKLTKTFKRPFQRWIKKSYMILDLTLLLLYIPTPPFFNVYSKRDSNPEVRMTPLCMQRSVFVGSYEGLGD